MSTKTHQDFLREALEIASGNARGDGGGPFGAVIVKDGVVLSQAANSVTPDCDPTAHAEVNAIRKACKSLGTFNLHGCVLYASCEPCPMCLAAAYWAGVDAIYYAGNKEQAAGAGFSDAFIYTEFAKPIDARRIPMRRLLSEEGGFPFELWEQNSDRKVY